MSVEDTIKADLNLLNDNIMQAARLAALGSTEEERVQASKLYDELAEKRTKLQAAVKVWPSGWLTRISFNGATIVSWFEGFFMSSFGP